MAEPSQDYELRMAELWEGRAANPEAGANVEYYLYRAKQHRDKLKEK